MIPACDVSKYQGIINWANMPAIALIKMSGGDMGLYIDPMASANYSEAKANGKHVGGYHYIGWALGASAEATYFLQAMSPLAENDVYALDIESIPANTNPVPYVAEMVNLIHDKINVWALLYMNLSTLRTFNWNSLLTNCGLWLADWNNNPAGTIPNVPIYVMQQYSDTPNYDHDEWFGTMAEFDAYGYHSPVVATASDPSAVLASIPTTPVVSTPEPVQSTAPVVKPVETAVSTPQVHDNITPQTTPTIQSSPSPDPIITKTIDPSLKKSLPKTTQLKQIPSSHYNVSFWRRILSWVKKLLGIK